MNLRQLVIPLLALLSPSLVSAAILVKIPGFGDPGVDIPGYDNGEWFQAESFSFGVDRDDPSDGEKGGTEDINIGIGELQECTISKSMDRATPRLAQFAINGNSCGTAEIHFVTIVGAEEEPVAYLKYKLDRCFVKSWSTSGDADDRPTEDVAFYYNKIAFAYAATEDGKNYRPAGEMGWDRARNQPWTDHGLRAGN